MRTSSYVVYWLLIDEPHAKSSSSLLEVLALTEELRAKQRGGAPISHVTFAVEDPDSVGHPGVDVVGPDYDWKKRRL